MPLRFIDRRAHLGSVIASLSGASALLQGTHTAPVARTGTINTQLQGATSSIVGQFVTSANRTGTIATTLAGAAASWSGTHVPPIINVSNVTQLMSAINSANGAGNVEIRLANGTYTIPDALFINAPNIRLRSTSGVAANVIIQGDAISGSAAVPFIVRVAAADFVAENLTFGGRCRFSAIQVVGEGGANNGRLSNCIVRDSFEHLLKSSTDGVNGASGWIIEDTQFLFTAGQAPAQYNGGIDVHRGTNWIVRRNTFRDIASPASSACQHAVNFWNGSIGTLIERNRVIDCDRGIGSGLNGNPANNNETIRNNQCYHSANSDAFADVQLSVENSTNAKVYNNTVYVANSFPWAMEYRFTTTGTEFRNNLSNKAIQARDGATATLANNVTNAQASYFVDLASGNLDLASSIAGVVDAGATLASVTEDFGGIARPQGSAYDIGSDEFVVVANPLDLPIVPMAAIPGLFTYLGQFNVPTGGADTNNFTFSGSGLCPMSDGLYMGKDTGAGSKRFGKMSIPAFGGTATITVPLTTVPGIIAPGPNSGSDEVSGARMFGSRLYVTAYNYYDGSGAQVYWIRSAAPNLSSFGPWCRMSATGGAAARHLAGGLMQIPALWQATLGGPMGCFGGGMGIVSNACNGPGLGIFNPAVIPDTGTDGAFSVPVTTLLHYPLPQTLVNYLPPNYYQTEGNPHLGMYIVPGSRTLLVVHVHGNGSSNACDPGSSVPAAPYRVQILPYDLRDLVNVKNGVVQPYAPKPYGFVEFPNWTAHYNTCVGVPGGHTPRGGFDNDSKRLYMVPDGTNGNDPIKVWSVADYVP